MWFLGQTEGWQVLGQIRDPIPEAYAIQVDVNTRKSLPRAVRIVVEIAVRLTSNVDPRQHDCPTRPRLKLQPSASATAPLHVQ